MEARRRIAELEAARERDAGRDSDHRPAEPARLSLPAAVELDRARRHGRPVALALLDVDGFRELDAHHGHKVADMVLAHVGARA